MKPRIFIGSSKEALEVAERIKNYFSDEYDCTLWSDGVFQNNESFLETLLKSTGVYDFGFMVFSADDKTISKRKSFNTPRDNMVFEFGLFLGSLGIGRSFIIAEKGGKIPTDLCGFTCARYETTVENGKKVATESLERELAGLKAKVSENAQLGHLGLLASTVLAVSYFDNFVKHAAAWIRTSDALTLGDHEYQTGFLNIVMPDELESDMKTRATEYYKSKNLSEGSIQHAARKYPVKFDSHANNGVVEIYDMPTTLNGIYRAICMHFRNAHIGKTAVQKQVESKELHNFRRVLQCLIADDAHCRACVRIV